MRLEVIVETSRAVAATRKRNEKIARLAQCIAALPPDAIEAGVGFLAGQLRQGKIGIGYANVQAARGIEPAQTASLTLGEVDEAFARIAGARGAGSAANRKQTLHELLRRATAAEQEFLRRLVVGELRQGALESLVVDAIARAAIVPLAAARRARMLAGDLGALARVALVEGESGLARFSLRLFHPVEPMLAASADSVEAALSKFTRAAFELKLDGARVQVHKSGPDVRVFTRRLNDVTAAVPEVVEAVHALPIRECVLDGETIAMAADGTPEPFQVTMRRFGRRTDVEAMRASLPLVVFFFDCLALDGATLLDARAEERAAALAESLPANLLVPRTVTENAAEGEAFLADALASGHEGVMAKSLDAAYEAGRRGASWLKLKPAHSLDLVVIAAEWGSGRRRGWLSNLHLAARETASGRLVMLGKTFKGMTDSMLAWQTRRLLEIETRREGHIVHVEPRLVVEVAFNDVQTSPQYAGGLALRFARVKRYREDKGPEDADTFDAVRALHAGTTD